MDRGFKCKICGTFVSESMKRCCVTSWGFILCPECFFKHLKKRREKRERRQHEPL